MPYVTDKSRDLFARSLHVLIEGVSSPSRGPANYGAYPLFMERGEGPYIYDADGNRYVDWMMCYGLEPLGHAHPCIVQAVSEAVATGPHFAAATEIEVEVAELIQQMVPSAERVRFANTGTEATMAAIRLARGYTGKPKFIKFEGHYHGWYDDFLVSVHPAEPGRLGHRNDPIKLVESSGLNRQALDDTIVVPWNDLQAVERAIDTYRGQIAAVITEPVMANMGIIPPEPGYLQGLRDLTRDNGILLIFDEVTTNLHVPSGTCQKYYGIKPDISTLGKALGNGLPVAALVGRADIMEALAWGGVLHYGAQNASRIGLYATRAGLQELNRNGGEALHHAERIAQRLTAGLRELFAERGTKAIVQNVGAMLQIFFTERPAIRDYRDFCANVNQAKFKEFARALFKYGVYLSPSPVLHSIATAAHTDEHVNVTLDAMRRALRDIGQ
ncbi:MAG: glutamate-1-semialdehyde 2,1-aminomutase [Chloroflexi bacterium]|nr:glutamate-1-semialdehyde 2,1-aminomutase [Chloroflexota bacterium]